jgi:hypothetical protein
MPKSLVLVTLLMLAGGAVAAAAQSNPAVEEQNADRTRERVRQILDQYPPSLRQVLRCDPSLLTRGDYLTSYPTLAAYVAQHPDVVHNPAFFIGEPCTPADRGGIESRSQMAISLESIFVGLEVTLCVMFAIGTVAWMLRSGIDYRRWQHAMKVQTDAHTKLVDRLTSNDDLLAYVNSPAGQRFLTASPVTAAPPDSLAMPINAPINRILWSVQAGIIIAAAGIGLWIAKNNVVTEAAQALQVFAILAVALGLGAVVSAVASWLLSKQLGLVQSRVDHA